MSDMGDMSGMGGMDGMDGMMGGMGGMDGILSPDGVDFSNMTQAMNFLSDLLDDDELKIIGNDYARYFWYGICVVIAIATFKNLQRRFTEHLRLRDAAQGRPNPARPRALPARWMATITAIVREASYSQYNPLPSLKWFKVPPTGVIILLLAYLSFVLALEFIYNDIPGGQHWESIGVRAGWLAVAQIPLIILLVMKNNLITLLTGVSYERLNVLHRWSGRILLLMAILHFGYQSYGWQYYGIMQLEWATDTCPPTGIAAFAILLWMNLSTLAPFRFWSYEFFVAQHIVTFFGFIIALMIHLPTTALWSRIYVYIPIALYLLDRIARTLLFAWTNLRVSRASLTSLDGPVTKIRLSNAAIRKWRPGAHVLLAIPRFGPFQSHPATILSTPSSHDGDLVFLLKTQKGFTKRILNGANNSTSALLPQDKQNVNGSDTERNTQIMSSHIALLDGPYAGLQSDFATFSSVMLIAGSTGCTYTLALFQDLAERATADPSKPLPVRSVHFIWCVKDTTWVNWIRDELSSAHDQLNQAGIEVVISIYVTCAEKFTEIGGATEEINCGCAREKIESKTCCCANLEEEEETEPNDVAQSNIETIKPVSQSTITLTAKQSSSSASSFSTPLLAPEGQRLSLLPAALFYSGRPDLEHLLRATLESATGETGVATCGPHALNAQMRNLTVRLSDERAVHKGTGAQGCYLHVEAFS